MKQGIIQTIIFLSCLLFSSNLFSQTIRISNEKIHSPQVLLNDKVISIPVMTLGTEDKITIEFDDLTKEYHRYTYEIEHCNHQWQRSNRIFPSDYLRGTTNKRPIEDYEESMNTSVEYIHYSFSLPNEKVKIVYSGNYKIHIYDDDTKKEVAQFCFMIVENQTSINTSATTNTEIDFNQQHQQIKLSLNCGSLDIHDPKREIKMVVIQNGNWDKAVWNPEADFYTPSDIKWEHNKELIFKAGSEFRKFEMTNLKSSMMGVDKIEWIRPYYHTSLFTTVPRNNYIYDEEQNGRYYINVTDRNNPATEADYALVHFSLKYPPSPQGNIFIYGGLTNWNLSPESQMQYNPITGLYEQTLLLKEGYYNYQYIYLPTQVASSQMSTIEGNYYQTENEYTILVYYAERGSRYERLVGYRNFTFNPARK